MTYIINYFLRNVKQILTDDLTNVKKKAPMLDNIKKFVIFVIFNWSFVLGFFVATGSFSSYLFSNDNLYEEFCEFIYTLSANKDIELSPGGGNTKNIKDELKETLELVKKYRLR